LLRREILEASQREAKPLLYNHFPFPLIRGRGIKGDGVTKQNLKGVRLVSNLLTKVEGDKG